MMGYIILFFLAGPVILGVGNLVIGPIFNKQTPFRVQVKIFCCWFNDLLNTRNNWLFLLLQGKL